MYSGRLWNTWTSRSTFLSELDRRARPRRKHQAHVDVRVGVGVSSGGAAELKNGQHLRIIGGAPQEPIYLSLSGHGRSLARGAVALYAAVQTRAVPTFGAADQENGYTRTKHHSWADLLSRTFQIDVLACPACGGRLRLIATIEHRAVIEKILRYLGLSGELPESAPPRHPSWLPGFEAPSEPAGEWPD